VTGAAFVKIVAQIRRANAFDRYDAPAIRQRPVRKAPADGPLPEAVWRGRRGDGPYRCRLSLEQRERHKAAYKTNAKNYCRSSARNLLLQDNGRPGFDHVGQVGRIPVG
jgi:hypothetical protein